MNIKVLKIEDLINEELANLNRHQVTNTVRFVEKGIDDFKSDYFVDNWDRNRKLEIVEYLKDCIVRGGVVVGAYDNDKLIGFANIESELFGANKEYIELPFMHVSKEYRGNGIGKEIINVCKKEANKKGARKLYIGAHPAKESQMFYKSIGCVLAKEINIDIYNREKLDIQLELLV